MVRRIGYSSAISTRKISVVSLRSCCACTCTKICIDRATIVEETNCRKQSLLFPLNATLLSLHIWFQMPPSVSHSNWCQLCQFEFQNAQANVMCSKCFEFSFPSCLHSNLLFKLFFQSCYKSALSLEIHFFPAFSHNFWQPRNENQPHQVSVCHVWF